MDLLALGAFLLLAFLLRTVFSWRMLALAAGGLLLLGLAATVSWPLRPVFLAYNALLAGAFLLDYFWSAKPKTFMLTREMNEVLSLGVANHVTVRVEYRGSHNTRLAVQDEAPRDFTVRERILKTSLRPGQTAALSYAVIPPKRGLFRFERLHYRYRGRLGLCVRQVSLSAGAEAKVYPDVLAVEKFDLLARTGRLAELGLKAARLRGTGTNFESVREYVPGDEFRWINWKATARRARPQTNEYQVEQTQNIFLLLDTGRLMVTRAGSLARLDHAINAALMLAYVATGKGDRVGAMAFREEIQGYLAPGKGRSQVTKLIEFLYPLQPEMVESDYARALSYFSARNRKHSLVCVFTDLIDDEVSGMLLSYLAALAPPHIPMCITLRDPLLDAATQEEIAEPASVYTKAVAEQVLTDRARARRCLERSGVLVVDVRPEDLSVAVVNKYLALKERGRI